MTQYENPKELTIQPPAEDVSNAHSRPLSSPIALQGIDLSSIEGSFPLASLPPLPASPPPSSPPKHNREPSKNLLDGLSQSKPRDRSPQGMQNEQTRPVRDDEENLPPSNSSMSKIYHLRKAPDSTPELSLVGSAENIAKGSVEVPPVVQSEYRPQPLPHYSEDSATSKRKDKPFRNPLNRAKSIRQDSNSSKSRPNGIPFIDAPPKTAPLSSDWPGSEMLRGKTKERRGKSAERQAYLGSHDNTQQNGAMQRRYMASQQQQPHKEKDRNTFIGGGKNAFSKVKAGGGNFLNRIGKIGRSGSSHEKETHLQHEEAYVLKVINQPLVDQTRITRISKSLDACKDKTEYWMPSLPWRCIDYLNLNCESEGLYRIPGSGPQIKQWQRRFDTEIDIDLLDETELYDPNNISSLLKQWLRELPTEIFPAELQAELATELEKDNAEYTKMGQPAPQKLRDALSELSPFNYYLLFAITCHLSLLVSHQEKNRMDLNNLSICIGPCLKMERWLFNYLVGDWRHCWQGCWTEKQALEAERKFVDPSYVAESDAAVTPSLQLTDSEERAVSSSGESLAGAPPRTSTTSRPQASRENSGTRSSSSSRGMPQQQPQSSRQNSNNFPTGLTVGQPGQRDVNGGFGASLPRPSTSQDVRRPATADSRRRSDEEASAGTTTGMTRPRIQGHVRSQSEIPTSPISPASE